MKLQRKKMVGVILAICMLVVSMVPIQVDATSTEMINASIYESDSIIYAGEEVGIQMVFECTPYENKPQPTDVILVMDRSGSMSGDFSELQNAAKKFISTIDLSIHRVGIVDYDDGFAYLDLTTDKNALLTYISNLSAGGGTMMARPIEKATQMLQARKQGTVGAIVLMTDGIAGDQQQAIIEANKAKTMNCVFYTVAFSTSATSNSDPVIANLMKMATSEADHYSVFEKSKLTQAYNNIAGKIGAIYPTNVIITQTIPGQFELVADSTKNNIPQPVVSGNYITWSMNQLGQGQSIISYRLKAKEDVKAGIYNHAIGEITYIDYSGNVISRNLKPCAITVERHAPKINSITPNSCKNGDNQQVTMDVSYVDTNAEVSVGNSIVSNATINGNILTFTMPDLVPGVVNVKVTNNDGQFDSTSVTIEENAQILKIEDNWCDENDRKIVTIYGKDILTKADNRGTVSVMVGGKKASITAIDIDNQTITCKVPKLSKGSYDVKVTNAANTEVIMPNGFEYKEKNLINTSAINMISPSNGVSNARLVTKITGVGFKGNRATIQVIVDGKNASILSASETEIECKLSKLVAGNYDVKVVCSDGTEIISTNAITIVDPAPRPLPSIDDISPNVVNANDRTVVMITGKYFRGNRGSITVMVGDKKASIMSVSESEGKIECKLPYLSAGTYDVVVTFDDNTTAQSSVTYQ